MVRYYLKWLLRGVISREMDTSCRWASTRTHQLLLLLSSGRLFDPKSTFFSDSAPSSYHSTSTSLDYYYTVPTSAGQNSDDDFFVYLQVRVSMCLSLLLSLFFLSTMCSVPFQANSSFAFISVELLTKCHLFHCLLESWIG